MATPAAAAASRASASKRARSRSQPSPSGLVRKSVSTRSSLPHTERVPIAGRWWASERTLLAEHGAHEHAMPGGRLSPAHVRPARARSSIAVDRPRAQRSVSRWHIPPARPRRPGRRSPSSDEGDAAAVSHVRGEIGHHRVVAIDADALDQRAAGQGRVEEALAVEGEAEGLGQVRAPERQRYRRAEQVVAADGVVELVGGRADTTCRTPSAADCSVPVIQRGLSTFPVSMSTRATELPPQLTRRAPSGVTTTPTGDDQSRLRRHQDAALAVRSDDGDEAFLVVVGDVEIARPVTGNARRRGEGPVGEQRDLALQASPGGYRLPSMQQT